MQEINKIVNNGLCLGCGLCETIATKSKCQMILNYKSGFYEPNFIERITELEENKILKSCPSLNINGNKDSKVWGNILKSVEGWSSNSVIRKKATSGGVISTLAINLLESKKVNAVLHVGPDKDSYLYNSLKVSRTKDDVLDNVGSRYAPSLVLNKLKLILDSSHETYAMIGKPCDIAGAKNFILEYPKYENRINYFLSIFCMGMPSYNDTENVIAQAGHEDKPVSIKYRGEGWPGFFEAEYQYHKTFKMSYNDTWGKVLGRNLCYRCKICPDGIGLLADVVVGDSWIINNGYPSFAETDGRSFIFSRTVKGVAIVDEAIKANKIQITPFDINKLKSIQKSQYDRRKFIAHRILPIFIHRRIGLNFKKVGILKLAFKANIFRGVKEILGSTNRYLKQVR